MKTFYKAGRLRYKDALTPQNTPKHESWSLTGKGKHQFSLLYLIIPKDSDSQALAETCQKYWGKPKLGGKTGNN